MQREPANSQRMAFAFWVTCNVTPWDMIFFFIALEHILTMFQERHSVETALRINGVVISPRHVDIFLSYAYVTWGMKVKCVTLLVKE